MRRSQLAHQGGGPDGPSYAYISISAGKTPGKTRWIGQYTSATIGTSPGKIGTAVAQQHLKSILSFCNSPQMNAIEAYIQFSPGLIGDAGEVTDATTEEFLANYMKEFAGFIDRVYTAIPRQSA